MCSFKRVHTQQQRRPHRSPSFSRRTQGCRLKQPGQFLQEPGCRSYYELCFCTWRQLTHLLRADPDSSVEEGELQLLAPPSRQLGWVCIEMFDRTEQQLLQIYSVLEQWTHTKQQHSNIRNNNAVLVYCVLSLTGLYPVSALHFPYEVLGVFLSTCVLLCCGWMEGWRDEWWMKLAFEH